MSNLQKILLRLQRLHPKEIDLSLDRIKLLCSRLGNPQNEIDSIQVCGTNGKGTTIAAARAILKEANIKCNVWTSPHVKKINERFVYNDEMIADDELAKLLSEVEEVNDGNPLTYFEALTATFFHGCRKYKENLTLLEFGLFGRHDAVNILKKNLANVITLIGEDHLDWLPENDKSVERIIFEKTSSLLNSNIIVAKQNSNEVSECIKKNISKNDAKKIFYNEDYNFVFKENGFFYYEDQYGGIKISNPNINGAFQIENIATAIATLRTIKKLNVKDHDIQEGVKKIKTIARLEEIKDGKLKQFVKNNRCFCDGSHNPDGFKVLNDYLQSLNCDIHIIIGMMANKDHKKCIDHIKNIKSLTTVDIKNQPNAISGKELKEKLKYIPNVIYQENIEQAIKSVQLKDNDVLVITGSLYLASEVLNLN